jgi:hypothetical protein
MLCGSTAFATTSLLLLLRKYLLLQLQLVAHVELHKRQHISLLIGVKHTARCGSHLAVVSKFQLCTLLWWSCLLPRRLLLLLLLLGLRLSRQCHSLRLATAAATTATEDIIVTMKCCDRSLMVSFCSPTQPLVYLLLIMALVGSIGLLAFGVGPSCHNNACVAAIHAATSIMVAITPTISTPGLLLARLRATWGSLSSCLKGTAAATCREPLQRTSRSRSRQASFDF